MLTTPPVALFIVVAAGALLGMTHPVAPLLEPKPHGYVEFTLIVVCAGEGALAMKPAADAADNPAAISVPPILLSCDDQDVPMVPVGQTVLLLIVVHPQTIAANSAASA